MTIYLQSCVVATTVRTYNYCHIIEQMSMMMVIVVISKMINDNFIPGAIED